MRRPVPYGYRQALAFVATCLILGAALGVLIAWLTSVNTPRTRRREQRWR